MVQAQEVKEKVKIVEEYFTINMLPRYQLSPLQLFKINLLEFERHSRMLEKIIEESIKQTLFRKSIYIDKNLATRETHALNDEAAYNVESQIDRLFKGSKHPYFNRKPEKSTHGQLLDGDTLYKLGQMDIDKYEAWLQRKAEVQRKSPGAKVPVLSKTDEMRLKQKQLEKEAEARYLERIAILSASRDADDPAFYDIPILPYVP